jgi:hypothetical protein
MADKEPRQKTAKGHDIPIPTRGEFFGDLGKVARPPSDRKRRPKKNLGK